MRLPASYKEPAEKKGTVEEAACTTDVYGDGRSGDLPNLFYREVTESILPAVETKYNT